MANDSSRGKSGPRPRGRGKSVRRRVAMPKQRRSKVSVAAANKAAQKQTDHEAMVAMCDEILNREAD